ncbi:hypothetical protein EVAR_74572_1 [Eumeta japonica]|uniref:Uncharacterized protein n=1 Tax=Eumeta variegata TaxID=151549 RepID=A0A4C1TCN1_EUMVA|nr:hypothetical protein EVAR_74572_1 [Eumeta japonica]
MTTSRKLCNIANPSNCKHSRCARASTHASVRPHAHSSGPFRHYLSIAFGRVPSQLIKLTKRGTAPISARTPRPGRGRVLRLGARPSCIILSRAAVAYLFVRSASDPVETPSAVLYAIASGNYLFFNKHSLTFFSY